MCRAAGDLPTRKDIIRNWIFLACVEARAPLSCGGGIGLIGVTADYYIELQKTVQKGVVGDDTLPEMEELEVNSLDQKA